MAIRGRPPKSNVIKDLAGTVRPSRRKTGMPATELQDIPEAPEWLNTDAKKIFRDVCGKLLHKKVLFESDINLLAVYAHELWTYQTAVKNLNKPENHVKTTKSGYEQPSPWISIRNQAQKNVRDIGALFGLDPLNRNRFNLKDSAGEENGLTKLLMKYNTQN